MVCALQRNLAKWLHSFIEQYFSLRFRNCRLGFASCVYSTLIPEKRVYLQIINHNASQGEVNTEQLNDFIDD